MSSLVSHCRLPFLTALVVVSLAAPRASLNAGPLVAPTEALTPEDAAPEDFVDLGEETEFKVETLEGECVA